MDTSQCCCASVQTCCNHDHEEEKESVEIVCGADAVKELYEYQEDLEAETFGGDDSSLSPAAKLVEEEVPVVGGDSSSWAPST